MSTNLRTVLSYLFLVIPSLMVIMAGLVKISGSPEVVDGLSKLGLGPYVLVIGVSEIIATVLLFVPRTQKVAFFFMLSFLGGAAAVDLVVGKFPIPMVLTAFLWIGMFLKHSELFLPEPEEVRKPSHA